jgi:hypothetical protein
MADDMERDRQQSGQPGQKGGQSGQQGQTDQSRQQSGQTGQPKKSGQGMDDENESLNRQRRAS